MNPTVYNAASLAAAFDYGANAMAVFPADERVYVRDALAQHHRHHRGAIGYQRQVHGSRPSTASDAMADSVFGKSEAARPPKGRAAERKGR